jgi:hypothetical protein
VLVHEWWIYFTKAPTGIIEMMGPHRLWGEETIRTIVFGEMKRPRGSGDVGTGTVAVLKMV